MTIEELKEALPVFTNPELVEEILEKGQLMNLKVGKVLMEPGQFVKMVPIVLDGSIKISRIDDEGRELFLYYLDAGETCALSLTCCTSSKPSEIKAVVERDATIIGIPINVHQEWSEKFKQWKDFVNMTYQNRFQELLAALDAVAFMKMDERLMNYLVKKMKQHKTNEISTTHQEIAIELSSSREVISRLLKQLEKKKWIELGRNVIYIRDDFEELIKA
jgi:CRP/FNR family transcriptional regulator